MVSRLEWLVFPLYLLIMTPDMPRTPPVGGVTLRALVVFAA